jgi:opacity protein-like surface antigen
MRKLCLLLIVFFVAGIATDDAHAESALTIFGGANIGGDLSLLTDGGNLDLATSIKNSPIFGARVGTYGFPIGFEGSLTYSPSAIIGGINDQVDINTNILYVEANVLVIILPGPIAPFVTGGIGLHYLNFNLADLVTTSSTKFGWNLGGGLKMNVSRVALRVDIRDHITTIGLNDVGLGIIGDIIGIASSNARVHNVELSFGVGIRF